MKKRNILIIIILNMLIILLSTRNNMFGSTMDFLNQHVIFPEYLRNTFYETGKILPKFTWNLGGGENIYNIAYYGLLNPLIILSYLFPFIKMIHYIIGLNIVLLIISDILFYKFMSTKFDGNIAFISSLLFTLSGPLIFQMHRQFMFVNYFPFLLLALINVDKDKKFNLMIDIFLIIMISFYYSIPSILVIIIYYLYVNFDKFNFKDLLKLLGYISVSILCSMILVLPTLCAIVNTRYSSNTLNIASLLIPNFDTSNFYYGSYTIGLTSIFIISLIYLWISKPKKNKFLFFAISVVFFVPIFMYFLNGGLYVRGKTLIPFLPICVMIIGKFMSDLYDGAVDIRKLLIYVLISGIFFIGCKNYLYYLDLFFMVLLILLYLKFKNKKIMEIPLILLYFILCLILNSGEHYISNFDFDEEVNTESYYRTISLNNTNETVNKVYGKNHFSTSIYSSTLNKYYNNLYHNVFKVNNPYINNLMIGATDNVLFNQYMGVRYVISDNELFYPYVKVDDNLYELASRPIGYVSCHKVNKEYYDSLAYPYNVDILMNFVIDEQSNNKPISKIKKIEPNYTYELGSNISLDGNRLIVLEDDNIQVYLSEDYHDKLLFISVYGILENENDISMDINGQTNLLTKKSWLYPNHNNVFYYCLNNVTDKLEIYLSKGVYNIDAFSFFVLDDFSLNGVDEFNIEKMEDNVIKGNIDVTEDGTFILSVPYDKGFSISVNGDKVGYRLINDTFIGFDLKKGHYDIMITYEPPGLFLGIIFSCICFIIILILGGYNVLVRFKK